MTATSPITFRKTKTGEWVAFGPVAFLDTGEIAVVKRDGSRKYETCTRVGRTFLVDGVECAYGYLAPRQAPSAARRTYSRDEWLERRENVAMGLPADFD